MRLRVDALSEGAHSIELVERKGLGHPDSICDALAEELSRSLSRYCLAQWEQSGESAAYTFLYRV